MTQPRLPPFPRCSAHITHLLGSLSFFTFLLSLKYSARLLLEEEAEKEAGVRAVCALAGAGLRDPGGLWAGTLTGQGSEG